MAIRENLSSMLVIVLLSACSARTAGLSEEAPSNARDADFSAAERNSTLPFTAKARERSDTRAPAAEPELAVYVVPDERHKRARPCLVGTDDCLALDDGPFEPCLLSLDRCPSEAQVERARGQPQRGK